MKSTLLTTTALVAFAGAAAADGHSSIGFSGEAALGVTSTTGVNDTETTDLYWDASIDVSMSAELDNGITASADFGINVVDSNLGEAVSTSDYVLSISGGNSSLSFGDIENVAEDNFGGADGSTATGFTEAGDEPVLAGSTTFGGFTAQVSFNADNDDLSNMQLHVAGDLGAASVELGYEDRGTADAIVGVAASGTFANATVTGSYVTDGTETSTGIELSYPVGAVTVGGYYSMNDVAEDNMGVSADYEAGAISVSASYDMDGGTDVGSYAIEGSYDMGNGLTVNAGVLGSDATGANTTTYLAGTYDLGGDASLLMSYATDGDAAALGEDLGDPEYNEGLTVEVSFAF
jgi:hypothetical protein